MSVLCILCGTYHPYLTECSEAGVEIVAAKVGRLEWSRMAFLHQQRRMPEKVEELRAATKRRGQ